MPKAVRVAVGHVDSILMLAHEHVLVYGHFLSVGHPGPFGRLLEGGPYLFVEFGGVIALQLQHLSIGANAENTFLDDSAGVHFGNIDIGAVVLGVDCTQVCWRDFIASVGLEVVQVGLVMDLANHVKILIGLLAGVGGSRLNRRRHLLLRSGILCIQVLSRGIGTDGSFEMTGASLLTRLRQGGCLVMGTQIDYALEYLDLSGINIGVFTFTWVFLPIAFIVGFQSCI